MPFAREIEMRNGPRSARLSCLKRGHGDDEDISSACEPLSFFIFSASMAPLP